MGLITLLLLLITLALPPLIKAAWGCRALPPGPVRDMVQDLLDRRGVKVRDILLWPLMGGRLVTAGVMGLVARWRYLLLTPALLENLAPEETRAVLAHEAAHIRRRHLWLYIAFFLAFMVLGLTLGQWVIDLALSWDAAARLLLKIMTAAPAWSAGLLSLPLLVMLVVYFRFVFAWYMRNFERQADGDAARVCGPEMVIAALEHVAALSGIRPRTPSWHHFSIAQRVSFLNRAANDPTELDRHDARVRRALIAFIAGLVLLLAAGIWGGLFNNQDRLQLRLTLIGVSEAVTAHPGRAELHYARAMLLLRLGQKVEAARAYARTIELAPYKARALNDLAWLYATGKGELAKPEAALELARRAVDISPEAPFLDTLAEAFFVNRMPAESVRCSQAALEAAQRAGLDTGYYEKQLRRFEKAAADRP